MASRSPARNPEIGMVFQDANLLPWRNLDANINFPFEIKGTKPDRAWIDDLLDRVGLDGFGGAFPRELSGGMQQRAALVRALSFKPSVLLMDEPFGALDAFTREEMNQLVEEIWLDTPTTIVFITHSIEEAIFLSDRIVVMSPRPGRVAKHPRGAVPAAALARDHGDQGGLRPHQHHQDGDRRRAEEPLRAPPTPSRRSRRSEGGMSETDAIPEFKRKAAAGGDVGISGGMSALAARAGHPVAQRSAGHRGGRGRHHRRHRAAAALSSPCRNTSCRTPSEIAVALVTDFPLIAPHLGLHAGRAVRRLRHRRRRSGLILAAVITQFPFAEKIITPYILLLVTTPMLALVPLLILRFGFGYSRASSRWRSPPGRW